MAADVPEVTVDNCIAILVRSPEFVDVCKPVADLCRKLWIVGLQKLDDSFLRLK